MKVRQSVSVTAELGDPNNLASFDGEIWYENKSTDSSSFLDIIKVNGFLCVSEC